MEQKEDTPKMAFIVELKAAAVLCKFGEIQDDMVHLQIKKGVCSKSLKERLISSSKLTDTIKTCKDFELLMSRREEMAKKDEALVELVQKSKKENTKLIQCGNCGNKHKIRECPAYNHKCHNCGRRNHFQKCCLSAQDSSTEEESSASEEEVQTKKKENNNKKKSSAEPKTREIQTDIIAMEEEFVDLHIH
jgi:hypothetical protein